MFWLTWQALDDVAGYDIFQAKAKIITFTQTIWQKSGIQNEKKVNPTQTDSTVEVDNDEVNNDEQREFSGTADALITLVNKERFDRDLRPLRKNKLLTNSAQIKAEDMIRKKYFEHVSAEGIQPWFFAEKAGYRYQTFGENIAEEYFSANSVHKAFMDSEGHRSNILSKEFKDIGVAILPLDEKNSQFLVVEHFGSYLRDVNPGKAKCGEKNRQRCKVQKKKRKELLKMIKISKNNSESIVEDLNKIKGNIDNYLNICQSIKKDCN